MKSKIFFIRFSLCLAFGLICFSGQAKKILQKVDIHDLSNNAILYMHQDRDGNMWLGTYDGLNLYNGKDNFVYRYEPANQSSISGNVIRKIINGGPEHIWVSNLIGVDRISLNERKVTESYLTYRDVNLLATDSFGNALLLSLDNFISYYICDNNRFIDIYVPGINPDAVHEIFNFEDQFFIITTDGLLKHIEIRNQKLPVTIQQHVTSLHNCDIIHASYDDGKIYFIDIKNRLYEYDCNTKEKQYITELSSIFQKYGRVISKIVNWHSDIYISFMNHGLIKIDNDMENNYTPVISQMGIFSLCKDEKQDVLWIGSDGLGVFMYFEKSEFFTHLMQHQLPYFSQKPIRSIYTDENNMLWFGTKGNGIFRIHNYDQLNTEVVEKKNVVHYTVADGLSDDQVFCFLRSKYRNILWIGTEGPGLSYYSYEKQKIFTIAQNIDFDVLRVHAICEINDSVLWLGTSGNGLLKVKIKEKERNLLIEDIETYSFEKNEHLCQEFYSMIFDGKQTLYAGSRGGDGVVRFDIETKAYDFLRIKQEEYSAAIGDVLCVHFARDSSLYYGASSGLTKVIFDVNGGYEIKQFDRTDGIANDMIHCMLEDNYGCLWLSTNRGLTKYNPQNDFFYNYSAPDLQVTEFSDDAYWKCPQTDRLFFGGVTGLIWLNAEKKNRINYAPTLRFWDLNLQGYTYPISKFTKKLTIPAKVPFFTVSFIATDYIYGDNYEYAYFIDGYSDAWFELQKSNEITFMNLPPGEYLLRVKCKNDVYDSNTKEYTLPLVVLSPWYLTKWAVFMYILCMLLCICFIFWLIQKRIRRQQQEVANQIKEEQKRKAYESKLNFFTNITHELFTPLALINGVADHLQKNIQSEHSNYKKHLDVLQNNVNNLNELIQEIIDFRKIEETGATNITIKRINISELIHKQIESFIPAAEKDRIQLKLDVPHHIYWGTDVSSFKKIFFNLISNAFKYVRKEGVIKVTLLIQDENLILKVYNTGVGIDAVKARTIFDRYHILENMEENKYRQMTARNGLGLFICYSLVQALRGTIEIVSEENQFAEVIVKLPSAEQKNLSMQQQDADKEYIEKTKVEYFENNAEKEKTVILVVDDNKDMVWFVSDTLAEYYHMLTANNVSEALVAIAQNQPALIITDIIMPNVDGLEFISQIRKDKFTKHIPIIIISAKITEHEQAVGLNAGADAYLTKPFSSVVLRSTVNRLLSNQKELRDYYYSPESAYEYSEGQLFHKEDKEFMEKVVQIIRDNISKENLRPELIAEQLGLNTRNLYRKVKKISSLSPSDFIKDYRFMYAAQLLISTNLSIQEIIYKVGITNKSYFYREFLKKYQVTPKEYRLRK